MTSENLLSRGNIILVIAVFAVPIIFHSPQTHNKVDVVRLKLISDAINKYYWDEHKLPETNQGLNALFYTEDSKNWNGPYLPYKSVPKDFWNNSYIYIVISQNCFQLYSIGKNHIDELGKGDDIYLKKCIEHSK